MSFNLKLHPQTALLFLLDALRTSGGTYRLDLYLEAENLGGVLHRLDDEMRDAQLLFAENDLVVLMGKVMEFLKSEASIKAEPKAAVASEGVIKPEPVQLQEVGSAAGIPDATGVPE